MFLEFSYSVWNLARTGIFIMVCWTVNRPSWKPPKHDLNMIMERCLALNNKAYAQLLLCAAGLPLLMNGHCLSQTVHNITCTANLLLFLVTLNGYHRRTILMLYYVLCTIAMNAQSVLVAVYNMYRNLQTERNDYVATLLYITELYLMLLVLADSSSRAINKVKNPELDIMSQDIKSQTRWPHWLRYIVYLLIQLYKPLTVIYLPWKSRNTWSRTVKPLIATQLCHKTRVVWRPVGPEKRLRLPNIVVNVTSTKINKLSYRLFFCSLTDLRFIDTRQYTFKVSVLKASHAIFP